MKNFLLFGCLLLSLTGWAQSPATNSWTEQGQLQIGIGASTGYGNRIGGYLRATPYATYFIKEGWAIGVEGRYNYNGPDGNQYVGAGVFTQYHVLRTSKFSLFGQAGYYYGQANYGFYRTIEESPASFHLVRYRDQFNYGMLSAGIGARYRLSQRWAINALTETYAGKRVNAFPNDGHSFTLGIIFRIK